MVVVYLNYMGGIYLMLMNFLVKEIWEWVIVRKIYLMVVYILGVENMNVDFLS